MPDAGENVADHLLRRRESMNDIFRYYVPTKDHTSPLCAVVRQVFSDTFARLYEPMPFAQYLEETYGPGGSMERDLADPSIRWQVAAVGNQIIGYAKLSRLVAPAPNPKPGSMELQQIYVLHHWHGKGVADRLIGWALDAARAEGGPEIYLTVFDHNSRAKRFYTRYGFAEVGHCTFKLGERIDDDRVWRKIL